jgi:hypothetical protein
MEYCRLEEFMNRNVVTGLLALALGVFALASASADQPASETRTINADISRVVLGGVATLQLRQGPTPALVVYADKDSLKQLTTIQHGDTLRIDTEGLFTRFPHARVELTLPTLSQFTSGGIGSAQVTGFSGGDLQLNVTGTGPVNVSAHYKHVVARLSGVGSMTLDDGDSESIDVSLPGTGHVVLVGRTMNLTSSLDGVGSLDAKELKADTVTINLHGVGSAKVYANDAANIYLHGIGSATVYGNPTIRNAVIHGFGKVTWESPAAE